MRITISGEKSFDFEYTKNESIIYVIEKNSKLNLNCKIKNNCKIKRVFLVRENSFLNLKNIFEGEKNIEIIDKIEIIGNSNNVNDETVFLSSGNSEIKISKNIIQKGKNCKCISSVKSVLFDNANAEIKGIIKIEKNAKNSNSELIQKALLIGKNANAIAFPDLDIKNNEVRAKHSAKISRIDEEELFYLKSRGIEEKKAVNILIRGFVGIVDETSYL